MRRLFRRERRGVRQRREIALPMDRMRRETRIRMADSVRSRRPLGATRRTAMRTMGGTMPGTIFRTTTVRETRRARTRVVLPMTIVLLTIVQLGILIRRRTRRIHRTRVRRVPRARRTLVHRPSRGRKARHVRNRSMNRRRDRPLSNTTRALRLRSSITRTLPTSTPARDDNPQQGMFSAASA
jgi:hypothetical protein